MNKNRNAVANLGVGAAIVNQVRQYASANYKASVPVLTASNLTNVGDAIMGFTPIYNEFLTVFFNKITLEIMDKRRYQNPFRELIKGGNPLGGVVQNSQVNPAHAMPYDVNATSRLLQNYRPDVVVEYYNINRKDLFAVTRAREEMELAFTSFNALDEFFSQLIDSLYNGNEIREFSLFKALIASGYLNSVITKVPTATPVDEDSAYAFLAMLQGYSLAFEFPSADYNSYQALAAAKGYQVAPRITWTPADDQIVIMDSKLMPIINLYVRASAFNEQYTKLSGRIKYVDNFGVTGMLAVIADARWLQVRDSKREFRDFENGATLTLNSFFHVWQYYNLCTWANAVVLYDPDAVAQEITVNEGEAINVGVDASVSVAASIQYDGKDYTSVANVSFVSSTNNMVIVYDKANGLVKVVTNKYSVPGEYTILMTSAINVDGKPVTDSTVITVVIS